MRPLLRRLSQLAISTRGATAVEFALVAVPFLAVVFGVMEYGRLMWTREALQQVAIAGARCMGLTQTECGTAGTYNASMTTAFVQSKAAQWAITLSPANMVLSPSIACAGIVGFSQVSLTYSFSSIVPGLVQALAGGVTLKAVACFPNHA